MLYRILHESIQNKLKLKNKAILLLGPRQVGKSTLLKQFNPSLEINLADEETYRDHLSDPGLIKRLVQALHPNQIVFIDEIQRIPSILNSIQALIDAKHGHMFLLTGSSARKLKKGQANLLPGRVFKIDLFPLTYWEMANQFDLEKSLQIGNLPGVYLNEFGIDILKAYIDVYLREEIQAEAIVRNISSFARFLNLAAENSGKILNYTKISSDAEIPKENLRRYYDILCDTLVAHRIPGFQDINGSRKATQKEKIFIFDVGVRNATLRQQKNVFTPTELGHLFEQWVILQLIAINQYHEKEWRFYYYRDDKYNEVDFIIDTGKKLIAIEIKYSRKIRPDYFDGINFFRKIARKDVDAYLIYTGSTSQVENSIKIMPYQKFFDHVFTL